MDIKRNLYEIDPNSPFNQLKCLQQTLKEENALREITEQRRKSIQKKIDNECYKFYKTKISIQNIYDHTFQNLQNSLDKTKLLQYQVIENPQAALPQCLDPLSKLVFHFRSSNERMLSLIERSEQKCHEDLATFLCHYCYNNILSPDYESGNLLMMIYLLLEKEVDNIKDKNSVCSFLDESSSFIGKVLKNLSRKNEVKDYLAKVLCNIICELDSVEKEEDKNEFLSLEPNKIKEYLKDHCKMKVNKNKKVNDYSKLLIKNIKASKVGKVKKVNELNKENAFYIEKKNEIDDAILNVHPNDKVRKNKDEITIYLEDTGLFDNSTNNYDTKNQDEINTDYYFPVSESELKSRKENEKTKGMKDYFSKILESTDDTNQNIFSNQKLLEELTQNQKDNTEKVILIFKYCFEKIKDYIDSILCSLIENEKNIPYMIRCICTIINRLLSIKFKTATQFEKNIFISRFFFSTLIFNIINNPGYNGIYLNETKMTETTKTKIELISKVLNKLISGNLFQSHLPNETYFTMFNMYFIEIMPKVFELFEHLCNCTFPPFITRLLTERERNLHIKPNRDISFLFFNEYPEEDIELQSLCLTWNDFLIFYDILKNHESVLVDQSSVFFKTYKKIKFHRETLTKKIEEDQKSNKKSYIFIQKTTFKGNLVTAFEEKSKRFSFQGNDDKKENDNEVFILDRVKYSIGTIIKHLNILTRANFFDDESESTANFVKGLTKMMELEGFSEMLKEKTIPLSWFGLYLIANIDNIPSEKKRSNYQSLYKELVDESIRNLNLIKNDNTVNYVYSKLMIVDKSIEKENNNLERILKAKMKYNILKFIRSAKLELCLNFWTKDKELDWIEIHSIGKCRESQKMHSKKKEKGYIKKECSTLIELIEYFPQVVGNDLENFYSSGFEIQKEKNIPNSIFELFNIISQCVSNDPLFATASNEDKEEINYEIQNYLYKQIYYKLFPLEGQTKSDSDVYVRCVEISWVEPKHFGNGFGLIEDNILQIAIDLIKRVKSEISPIEKFHTMKKAFELLRSVERLYDEKYKEGEQLKLLVYTIIKAMPMNFSSNLEFIEFYYPKPEEEDFELMIIQLNNAKVKIKFLNYNDLIGVSEEEFMKNEKRAREGL